VLLCFIDPRVRKIRNEAPVALESFTVLFSFSLSLAPPVHPSPIFLTDTENLYDPVYSSKVMPRTISVFLEKYREVPPDETSGLMTLHPHSTNVLHSITCAKSPYLPDRSNLGQKNNAFDMSMTSPSRQYNFAVRVSYLSVALLWWWVVEDFTTIGTLDLKLSLSRVKS